MDFDVAEPRRGQLRLSRMEQEARKAEPEFSLRRVRRTARQDAGARPSRRSADRHAHTAGIDLDTGDAITKRHPHAGTYGSVGELAVERAPIDHDRFDGGRRIFNRFAGRRVEAHRPKLVQDRVAVEPELVEDVRGEHARAVHRLAAHRMLLEELHAQPGGRELRGRIEAAWAAPDDNRIVHAPIIRVSSVRPTRPASPTTARSTAEAMR